MTAVGLGRMLTRGSDGGLAGLDESIEEAA
jgi:hypothetical protein